MKITAFETIRLGEFPRTGSRLSTGVNALDGAGRERAVANSTELDERSRGSD
jgi:hypothetical protein